MSDTKTFADLGVDSEICAALADAGIEHAFPIQELTLPLGLMGADVIGQARTGTGKTLAFGIPLLQRVTNAKNTQALVVVPTRELCVQVRDDLDRASARRGTRVVPVYGGKAIDAQAEAIRQGAPVIVGTPGRLLDLLRRGILDLSTATTLVLDEADEMLDLGFLPDVEALIEACSPDRQTLLFSATMPSAVVALARRYMRKPTFLRAEVEEARIAPETEQHFFSCHRMDKPAVLARILQTPGRGLCVVFTRTKRMADVLAAELRERGIVAAPIHSDLRQEARERALSKFRKGTIDVLVATEVAARGLDISDVTHVVNYDCPDDEKMYLHRIGRTGRAGGSGVAVTLAVWNELARLEMIKRALDVETPTHEVFSTSPILDELFDLPARGPRPAPLPAAKASREQGGGRKAPTGEGRGRGRKKRADAGATTSRKTDSAKPAASVPDEDVKQPAAAAASASASEEQADRGQVKSRTRTRRRSRADTPGRTTPARTRASTSAKSEGGAPATRERAPATRDTAAATGDTAAATGDSAPATRDTPAEDGGKVARRRVRTRSRVSTPAASATAPEEDTDSSRSDEKRPVRRKRSGSGRPASRGSSPSGRGKADSGQRGRRARPRTPRPEPRATSDREAVERVRGVGKPALHRPMVVTHLP